MHASRCLPDTIACMCFTNSCVNTASNNTEVRRSGNEDTLYPLHRLKQPEYQCYRTKIGTARNIETLEQISAELKSLLLVCSQCVIVIYLQWNLSNILGGKIIVLISEMSFFQGENNGWIQSSVLVNLGILIAEVSFKRGSTVVLFVFT